MPLIPSVLNVNIVILVISSSSTSVSRFFCVAFFPQYFEIQSPQNTQHIREKSITWSNCRNIKLKIHKIRNHLVNWFFFLLWGAHFVKHTPTV